MLPIERSLSPTATVPTPAQGRFRQGKHGPRRRMFLHGRSRQSRRSPQPSRISPTTLTTKIATSSPHDGRDCVEALPDRRPSPGIHTLSQPNIHHQMPPPPQHSLSQPNIHGPAHYPPHRPIPRGPPPQFLSQQFQTVEDGYIWSNFPSKRHPHTKTCQK